MTTTPHPTNSDAKLPVATIDDDELVRNEVRARLNGKDSCFEVVAYESPEAFFCNPPKDHTLLVLDEYFPVVGYPSAEGKPRAGEVIDFCLKRLPSSGIVIYSNNPVESYIVNAERVFGWADKTQPGALGAAVGSAIRLMPGLTDEMRSRCLDHLRRKEFDIDTEDPQLLPEVRTGRIFYPFRRPLPIESGWDNERKLSFFRLRNYPTFIEGTGAFSADARRSFLERFHERFKCIERMRACYETANDEKDRQLFKEIVDEKEYQNTRTITIPYLIGEVIEVQEDGARCVRWHGIPSISHHTISEVPSLVNVETGAWIRAVVEKRMSSEAVINILSSTEISPPFADQATLAAFWGQKE